MARTEGHDVVDVAPLLCPHVAQEVRRDNAVGPGGGSAVLLDNFEADIRMQFVVQRPELLSCLGRNRHPLGISSRVPNVT